MNDTLTRTLNKHQRKPKKYFVQKTQADGKQHKNHNTPQKIKKMRDTDSTNKHGGEPMYSRRASNSCFLLDTRRVTRIVKFSQNHVGDKGKDTFYIRNRRCIAI